MSYSPEITWLKRRWDLSDSMVESVGKLILAEDSGSTAIEVTLPVGAESPAITGNDSPLVTVTSKGRNYLQTRRMYLAEALISRRIVKMASSKYEDPDRRLVDKLFENTDPNDLQKKAAKMAFSNQVAIISGGPGTGKTYTLARILALFVESGVDPTRIRLAAPTGKASDRMKKAVADSLVRLPEEFASQLVSLGKIADSARTLHSLLGYNPDKAACSFNQDKRLPCSVLIVDECSMVDVLLWQSLLEALPDNARLILLGDPDQLESVGQGNVLGELTRIADEETSPLFDCHVRLKEARRFKDSPGILAFAEAISSSKAEVALLLLTDTEGGKGLKGLEWIPFTGGSLPLGKLPQPIMESLERVAKAPTPREALEALSAVCILTAQREYFVGSKAVSNQIDRFLSKVEGVRNRPIIINRNDVETGLKNGAVGVIHIKEDGTKSACFILGNGELSEIPVPKLPDHHPAWAITIHRSQGSEYSNVLVVVPQAESAMATRSLLYTAITRAKESVYVLGDLESVKKAVDTPTDRTTLLENAFTREITLNTKVLL